MHLHIWKHKQALAQVNQKHINRSRDVARLTTGTHIRMTLSFLPLTCLQWQNLTLVQSSDTQKPILKNTTKYTLNKQNYAHSYT